MENKINQLSLRSPSRVPYRTELSPSACAKMAAYPDPPPVIPLPESIAAQVQPPQVCVECLIGKQNKPTLFKVTESSSVPVTVSWGSKTESVRSCIVCIYCFDSGNVGPLFVETGGTTLAIRGGGEGGCIVLTETKFSLRYIPVWARYSPLRTRAYAITLSP